ncbi:MAG: hypothetical protein NHB32_16950 [Fischerella sp. CENA71]|nr:hypothetical protein [Fischerella sp. CENA71]
MENSLSNWQDSLNHKLVNRLTRPLRQPGMMKMGMSQRIINRCDRFLNRLPLLSQQMQRWGNTNTLSTESVPIVYAQSVSLAKEEGIDNKGDNLLPAVPQNQPAVTLIQRKLDSSQSFPTRTINNSIPIQNSSNLSSSDSRDETNQSLTLKTHINQPSIYSSEVPAVSPQVIAEELAKTSEMPLQDKFTDSKTISSLNTNIPSTPILDAVINETSISSSEIPAVSPQVIAEELAQISEMPLQGKFTDSKTASSLNTNIPSTPILDAVINETSNSSSEMPIVSPQVIAEELTITSEIPFAQEDVSISEQSLPIIQAKLLNSSLSSSLPLVNNLHTFDSPQQTQKKHYSGNFELIKRQILESNTAYTNFPIVTAQSPNSQAKLSNQKTSLVNNSPINQNHHNQNISPLTQISVTSPINPPLKPQSSPLPLAKTTPSSRSISQQPTLSNQNSRASTTDSLSSPPRTFASSLSTPETSISPIATQSNIDVDSIANQVERKLMRRLVIESERRGKIR